MCSKCPVIRSRSSWLLRLERSGRSSSQTVDGSSSALCSDRPHARLNRCRMFKVILCLVFKVGGVYSAMCESGVLKTERLIQQSVQIRETRILNSQKMKQPVVYRTFVRLIFCFAISCNPFLLTLADDDFPTPAAVTSPHRRLTSKNTAPLCNRICLFWTNRTNETETASGAPE